MNTLEQWLQEQTRQGRHLYLILDADGHFDERTALIKGLGLEQCRNLYVGTAAEALASVVPYIFLLDSVAHPTLQHLLSTPSRHWGWLASAVSGDLAMLSQHWQSLLVRGEPAHQVIHRFYDSRVFARTLAFLQPQQRSDYLGPVSSACYWQDEHWGVIDNPDPGVRPLPADAAWLNVPDAQGTDARVQYENVRRYLVGMHTEAMGDLARHLDIDTWLHDQLERARQWGWQAPQELHFLLMQSLRLQGEPWPSAWLPRAGDTPSIHFERVYREVQFWQGDIQR